MRNTDRNTLDEPFLCPAVGGLGENWIVARLLAMSSDGATLQDQTMYRCFQCLDQWPNEEVWHYAASPIYEQTEHYWTHQPDTYFEAVIHFLDTTMLAVEVETVVGTVAGRSFPSLPTIL